MTKKRMTELIQFINTTIINDREISYDDLMYKAYSFVTYKESNSDEFDVIMEMVMYVRDNLRCTE